ncbi:MAG: hypothetical protein EOP50_12780, partial [Sphingobacteriales bacterium]
MQLRILFFFVFLWQLSAHAQSDSGLRGRALFLEIESAKQLPPSEQPAAFVRIARAATESSQELFSKLLIQGREQPSHGLQALLNAAAARVSALGGRYSVNDLMRSAERNLPGLGPDTTILVRLMLADAAGFSGQTDRSARYRLEAETRMNENGRVLDRINNLDAMTRISNGPLVTNGYTELLRIPALNEEDRVHILSRLLINL